MKVTIESIRAWAADQGLLPTPGGPARTGSREVSFSAACDYVAPFIEACPTVPPPAFSPQWLAEPDAQVRFVAVLVAAAQWALQADTRQRAQADAETEIAAGIKATAPTPTGSARYVADDAAQPPFPYPARRSTAA